MYPFEDSEQWKIDRIADAPFHRDPKQVAWEVSRMINSEIEKRAWMMMQTWIESDGGEPFPTRDSIVRIGEEVVAEFELLCHGLGDLVFLFPSMLNGRGPIQRSSADDPESDWDLNEWDF